MPLERDFDRAMLDIYLRAKLECRYTASRFLQMLSAQGGLRTAQTLLARTETSSGFTELYELGRLELTVEAHVLDSKFRNLFTTAERRTAWERLRALHYPVDPTPPQ